MPPPDEMFWQAEMAELGDIMERHLVEAALAGAQTSLDALLAEAGVGVDWGLVNVAVREWAKQMSLDLVGGITSTSRRFTTQAIADWIDSGEPLAKLTEALEPMFGKARAEMISSTEVTRAFSAGNRETWKQSGVVDGMKWQTARDERVCPVCGPLHGKTDGLDGDFEGQGPPPAHVRCRCWLLPQIQK